MPEGDTILRTARTLARAISGKAIARVASPIVDVARAELAGHRVDAVEAHGKNLIVRFDDGRALHTHMRMNGAWHLYRAGERCLVCGDAIRMRHQGSPPRSTYYCPRCQKP